VSSVLATAQAGAAGIQSGDHILRYDNQRIYSGFELRQATTGGNAIDSVSVEVERDGEILEFYLIRGPLGIRMNSVSVAP
jgi:S1-C subfamily serine protease